MCEVLKVSRSSFYHWKKGKSTKRSERRAILSSEIFSIYHWSRGRYGSPQITRELEAKGMRASRPFVAKLMRERDLRSIVKKKFKKTTNSSHRYPVVENYLNQNFRLKTAKRSGSLILPISVQVRVGCISLRSLICLTEKL